MARTVPCVGGSYTPVDDDCSVADTAVRVSVTLVSEYAIEEDIVPSCLPFWENLILAAVRTIPVCCPGASCNSDVGGVATRPSGKAFEGVPSYLTTTSSNSMSASIIRLIESFVSTAKDWVD